MYKRKDKRSLDITLSFIYSNIIHSVTHKTKVNEARHHYIIAISLYHL